VTTFNVALIASSLKTILIFCFCYIGCLANSDMVSVRHESSLGALSASVRELCFFYCLVWKRLLFRSLGHSWRRVSRDFSSRSPLARWKYLGRGEWSAPMDIVDYIRKSYMSMSVL